MAVITTLQDSNIDNVNNMFIGLSGVTVAAGRYSRDGKIWTASTAPADIAWYAMTFGNNIAVGVATNANGTACNSTIDGINYVARTITAAGASRGWYSTQFGAVGAGIFVALTGGTATGTQAASSTDGISWTSRTCQTGDWRGLDYGNGRFVAVDYGNTTSQYSTDGTTWNAGGAMPVRANWISVAYSMVGATPTFVAIANGPRLVNFTTATTLAFTSGTKTITRAAGNFTTDGFVIGTTFTVTGSLSNDTTFTVATVSTTTLTVVEAVTTEAALATTVMTPTSYNAAYSTDGGASWTGAYLPSYTNWRSVCSNGAGKFVAVSSTADTKAAVSTNGTSWSSSTLPVAAVWNNVCFGNGIFVASSSASTNSAVSTDGTTWALWAQVNASWNVVIWAPFQWRSNDTLTIQNGNTVTVNTNQTRFWSGMTINNGTLRITNSSTTTPIRFTTGRSSGAAAGTITVANGLGLIDIVGNWITLATTGDGTDNQEITVPYTDYIPCLWVETAANSGVWEIWLNVSGAYGGSLRHYADGILDVSTGQRGKFFTQKPNTTQDQVISLTNSTTVIGSLTILVSSVSGIYPGATISGTGIPANTVVEEVVVSGNKLMVNQAATAAASNVTVTIYNPGVSQFLPTVVFGDNVHGNRLPTGAHVKLPNIMVTNDTAANLMTAAATVGTAIVTSGGARVSINTCLFDDAYSNFTQAQSLAITNVGMTYPPLLVEIYSLAVDGLGLGMPPVKRVYTTLWTNRDVRNTLSGAGTGVLITNYVSNATFNNIVIVCQSPNAVTAGTLNNPTSMIALSYSDNVTFANIRLYALNATRLYNVGLSLIAYVTNSTFTDIEFYGGPMLNMQLSSSNTFTRLINSESMFAYANYYVALTKCTYDPNTGNNMIANTKYYFKSRTYFTRDRVQYTQSRTYSATPFLGTTYFPDYIAGYCNATSSVTFGWTHRVPMYTQEWGKQAIEIYRGTSPGFTLDANSKIMGLNTSPILSIPTVTVWATNARTLSFDSTGKTITASSGSFITDGFSVGDKVTALGTDDTLNNKTFTINNVAATVLTVDEAMTTQGPYNARVRIIAKDIPALQIQLDSATARTLKFDALGYTASGGRTMQFTASTFLITSTGATSFITEGYAVGDKITVTGTTNNNTNGNFLTVTAVAANTLTVGGDTLVDEGPFSDTATITVNHLTASSGSFITDGYAVGDIVNFIGSTSGLNDNRNYTVVGVVALVLNFIETVTTQAVYNTANPITLYNRKIANAKFISNNAYSGRSITLQNISKTASGTRNFTFSVLKTITATGSAPGDFTITGDGWIVGDKIKVTGTTLNNSTFTITAVTATVITVSEMMFDETTYTSGATLTTNRIKCLVGSFVTDVWAIGDKAVVTGTTGGANDGTFTVTNVTALALNVAETLTTQSAYTSGVNITCIKQLPRLIINGGVGRTFVHSTSYLTLSTGSIYQDGYIVGDCIKICGTVYHNRVFNISALTTAARITTVEPQVADSITTNPVVWTHTGNKPTMASSAGRTLVWTNTTKIITASTGSFVTDGYLVNDRLFVTGTVANNGWYTITNVATLVLTLSEPIIADATTYNGTTVATITAYHAVQKATVTASASRTIAFSVDKTITAAGASPGSFIFDGFVAGDVITIASTTSGLNDGKFTIAAVVSATVLKVNEPMYTQVASTTPTITPISLDNGTTYYYKLRKYDASGVYNDSAEFEATPTEQQLGMNLCTRGSTFATTWTASGITVGAASRISPFLSHAATQTAEALLFTSTLSPGTLTQSVPTAIGQAYVFTVYVCTNATATLPTIAGVLSLGTATQAFTATAQWQQISVSFTATGTTTNAVITMNTTGQTIVAWAPSITKDVARPYLTTAASVPVINANEVRDISVIRSWCRAYGDAPTHSGIEFTLAAAVTGELWTEVYCGTTANFTPDLSNCIITTWNGSGNTIHLNNFSSDNIIDTYTQAGKGAPASYALCYLAASSSRNKILNLTYDLGGAYMAGIANITTQANDNYFHNFNISNYRNYFTASASLQLIAQPTNTFSGVIAQNWILNNSDFAMLNIGLNMIFKGVSGGNAKILNSAILTTPPITPTYVLGSTLDSLSIASAQVYDTIFHELYFTSTTGCLQLTFNASSKTVKPYTLTGTAYFANTGRLYLQTAGDSATYEWPHKIIGVTSFRNLAFKLNGLDLGNSVDLLEGLKIEYAIKTTGDYGAFVLATPSVLAGLTLPDPTVGFYLKIKLTAMMGMKYSTQYKNFVQNEQIRGIVSGATAYVDADFDMVTQGTLWLSSVVGTFVPGEAIVRHSDGEVRATNVATNTSWALFPSFTSYIDGLQIFTNVDQTAKYPAAVVTITLTNIVPGSAYYIFNSDTNVQIATGTATGTPSPGETTIDYSFSVVYTADTNITVNVRKSTSPVKYLPYETGSTITSAGANIFIAQVFDTVVIDLYPGISDDFTVNTTLKTIKHTGGTTIYTVKQLYSWLLDYFDNAGYLDDEMPIAASTPTEYNLINGWFIDDPSFKFLTGGAITSVGHASEIQVLKLDNITNDPIGSDLGKQVRDDGVEVGILINYEIDTYGDNTGKWWVRTGTGTAIANNSAITITSGTGSGSALADSLDGESVWSNIFTLGSLVSATTLDVYQNDVQITPWWPTDGGHIDILVKVQESSLLIDSGNLTILARTYGSLYDHFVINAASGRNPVPLAAFADGNNQTASGTVAAYGGFTFTFGYASKDLINGTGAQPYDCVIGCNNHTVAEIYEYLKYVTRGGSSTTLNGVSGEFYTGTGDIRFNYNNLVNTFVEGELISGTGSVQGYLVSLTGTAMVLRNVHGTFTNGMAISGTTNSATATVNGSVTTISPQKQAPFGSLAGGRFFGARGVFLENVASADANSYQLIDSLGVTQEPPSSISITISALESGDVVSVFRTTGNNKIIDKTYLHSHATNNSGATTAWEVDATTPIPADTPASGFIRIVKTSTKVEERLAYTSWSGNIFTLSAAHSGGYDGTDTAYVPYIDKTTASTSESVSITYVPGRYIYSLVRHSGIIPFDVKGTITATGYSLAAIRTVDTIVS